MTQAKTKRLNIKSFLRPPKKRSSSGRSLKAFSAFCAVSFVVGSSQVKELVNELLKKGYRLQDTLSERLLPTLFLIHLQPALLAQHSQTQTCLKSLQIAHFRRARLSCLNSRFSVLHYSKILSDESLQLLNNFTVICRRPLSRQWRLVILVSLRSRDPPPCWN